METITSRNNSKIKEARALKERKGRDEQQAFLVEGLHHIGMAVEARADLREIFYAPEYLKGNFARQLVQSQASRGVPCYATSPQVFASLAEKENPQGLLAVARQQRTQLESLNRHNFPWGAALITPQDPGNLGAILRTIDAVGASGVLLLEGGVDAFHPAAVRASLGAIFWQRVASASFADFLAWARRQDYTICGTSARGSLDYREVEGFSRPLILLLGSERDGLSPEQAEACDVLIRLPIQGHVTSLNLAVAAGIFLYRMLEKDV